MSEGLRLLLLVLGGLTVVLVVVLVVVRVLTELVERVTARRQDEVRRLLLTALLGEADESADALTTLRSREGRSWRRVEEQVFTMLPKIKGDSRELLVTLLLSRGAAYHAHANATARSMVRRSRGAHQLGALGQSDGSGSCSACSRTAASWSVVRRCAGWARWATRSRWCPCSTR